jgi:hypothetical protein
LRRKNPSGQVHRRQEIKIKKNNKKDTGRPAKLIHTTPKGEENSS